MNDGAKKFLDALRAEGIEPMVIDLDADNGLSGEEMLNRITNGECPIHGTEPCPDPIKAHGDEITKGMDSAELLRLAKLSLHFAVKRMGERDSNGLHDRLAIAETATALYDRQLAAEERAKLDNWGDPESIHEASEPELHPDAYASSDLRTATEREADENAARFPGNGTGE